MFSYTHKVYYICTPFCFFKVWKYLVMGGEMTIKLKIIEYQQTQEGSLLCLVLGMPCIGLQNPMFELPK